MHVTRRATVGLPRLALLVLTALAIVGACAQGPAGLASSPAAAPAAEPGVLVRVDGGRRFQTIDGLGVNVNGMVWDGGKVVPALDALSDGMGATLFRVIVDEADWEASNDNGDPRSFNWAYYDRIYAGEKFVSLWATLRYLERKPGARVMLNVMGRLPEWMGRGSLDPQAEDELVEMLTSLVSYGRREEGLKLALLSPLNEIDLGSPEGPQVAPAQYARLLQKLAVRLDELGLGDVGLAGPETAFPDNTVSYLTPMFADPLVMSKLDVVALHTYGSGIGDIPPAIAASSRPELPFWVTEYSRWCEGCLTGPGEAGQWSLGAETADFLFDLLAGGAAGALLWEGFDSYYGHHGAFQYWGILAYDVRDGSFARRHRYHTAAEVFRAVRPGMVRLGVEHAEQGLTLLAFRDPASGAVSIVGRNATGAPVTVALELAGLAVPESFRLTYTTEAAAGVNGGVLAPAGGTLTAVLPADSIFALASPRPTPGGAALFLPLLVGRR